MFQQNLQAALEWGDKDYTTNRTAPQSAQRPTSKCGITPSCACSCCEKWQKLLFKSVSHKGTGTSDLNVPDHEWYCKPVNSEILCHDAEGADVPKENVYTQCTNSATIPQLQAAALHVQ